MLVGGLCVLLLVLVFGDISSDCFYYCEGVLLWMV